MSRPRWRWVATGETKLSNALARLAPDWAEALADGRVFVDGRRASEPTEDVGAGSVVELHARRAPAEGVEILGRHGGLVFAAKPAGIATEPDHAGVGDSLVACAERLLAVPSGSLHALSRLDVGVSGVVTLACDAEARSLAEKLRAEGRFERRYLALAGAVPEPESGTWSAPIGRGRDGRRSVSGREAKEASTRYRTIARTPLQGSATATNAALLALAPRTGRTHQLRVHASAAGAVLLGDRSYGGTVRARLATGRVLAIPRPQLHALWVELGLAAGPLRVEAPVPADFELLWAELGGDRADLERAGDAVF